MEQQACARLTYGNHFGSHVANTALPALRGLVQNIVNTDPLVLLDQSIEVLLEEDILGGNIGKDEIDPGEVTVVTTTDDGPDDLQHGGDTSAAGNHTKVLHHVRLVLEGALGTAHLDGLTDDEGSHVLGDVALGV